MHIDNDENEIFTYRDKYPDTPIDFIHIDFDEMDVSPESDKEYELKLASLLSFLNSAKLMDEAEDVKKIINEIRYSKK